jgi:ubiquitin C-terminal hydrolase
LIINLHRLGGPGGQAFKECHPITFKEFIDVSAFTNPKCSQARYELTALISHNGRTAANGHYATFCSINGNWYLFDDSDVRIVNKTAVFDNNYPSKASFQTACLFVHRKV